MRVKLHTLPITFHRKNLKIDKKKKSERDPIHEKKQK